MMTTLEFLQRILPSSGWYFLALGEAGRRGLIHKAYDNLEEMAAAVPFLDENPNFTVYHACATYLTESITAEENGQEKTRYRVTSNGKESKAFWLDVDCGPEKAASGKGYETKKDAVAAIAAFCVQTTLPIPLIISSGNGVHFYWTLDDSISVSQWRDTASVLKAALAHCGVLADPSRTSDFSSVLRPVGSSHKKDPSNPREVKVVRDGGQVSFADFDAAVRRYVDAKGVNVDKPFGIEGDRPMGAASDNDFADYGYPEVPHSAVKMADGCQQVRFVRDTGGNDYQQWFGVVGLLKFCVNGDEIAHAWSGQSESYDSDEVAQKLRTWSTGPSKCSYFEQRDPGKCEGCQYRGKITTPLQLAKEVPVQEEHIEEVVNEDTGEKETVVVPSTPPGYWFDEKLGGMIRRTKNKDDVDTDIQFSELQFYPVTRVAHPDGSMAVLIRIHKRDGKVKEFIMKTEVVGMGAKEVRKVLGNFEVLVTDHPRAAECMEAYIRNAIKKLMDEAKEITTLTEFGWTADKQAFLLGDKLFKAGETTDVLVSGQAAKMMPVFKSNANDVAPWVDAVNWLYNKPGMELFQYTVCASLGSILSPFMEENYHGIPLALTGTKSAKGKTTAAIIAASAWGNTQALMINGKDGATPNAVSAILGTMQNIPILIDELSKAKADDIESMLYSMSNGKDKIRMKSKGGEVVLAEGNQWHSANIITSNTRIATLLASAKGNSQAEAVRVFEVYIDEYSAGMAEYQPDEVARRVTATAKNPGAVGRAFVEYVVNHMDAVKSMIEKVAVKVLGAGNFDPEHRFFRQHAVCTLVAATVLQKMGLVQFDVPRLFAWAARHIAIMSNTVAEINTMTAEDSFTRMVGDLMPRIITTDLYSTAKSAMPVDVRVYGPVAGRWIRGNGSGDEPLAGRLYLARKEMQDWAANNRADIGDILRWARDSGIEVEIKEAKHRFNLTRGTNQPPLQAVSYGFDVSKIEILAPGELRIVPTQTEKRSAGGQQ